MMLLRNSSRVSSAAALTSAPAAVNNKLINLTAAFTSSSTTLPTQHTHHRPLSYTPAMQAHSHAAQHAKAPSRAAMLSTYRALRRAIWQTFYTSSQYATYDELAFDSDSISGKSPGAEYRKKAAKLDKNAPHFDFANKRSKRWLQQLKDSYTANRSEAHDAAALSRLQRQADEMVGLLVSNMEHSRFLLEGGWGIRRNQVAQLTNVAHKVGLQMPKESAPLVWVPAGAKHQKARDAVLNKHNKFTK